MLMVLEVSNGKRDTSALAYGTPTDLHARAESVAAVFALAWRVPQQLQYLCLVIRRTCKVCCLACSCCATPARSASMTAVPVAELEWPGLVIRCAPGMLSRGGVVTSPAARSIVWVRCLVCLAAHSLL